MPFHLRLICTGLLVSGFVGPGGAHTADDPVSEFSNRPQTAHSGDVIARSGMRIGQDYERAMRRTRYRCVCRAGTGDLAGTYVCSFAEYPHLSYVFAPRSWIGPGASQVIGSLPPPDAQLLRIEWRAR